MKHPVMDDEKKRGSYGTYTGGEMFGSNTKHEEFYHRKYAYDYTLDPVSPEKGHNTPLEHNRNDDGDDVADKKHFYGRIKNGNSSD
jgi:hypothetical protein